MADWNDRLSLNADGKFYVDSSCIDCDLCRQLAPDNFTRDDGTGYSYVFRQPESEAETAVVQEAVGSCPTESIGTDGTAEALAEANAIWDQVVS